MCKNTKGPYKWTPAKRAELIKTIEETAAQPNCFLMGKLALAVGMTEQALISLGEDYPDDIGKSLKLCKSTIALRIVEGSMTKEYDSAMARFVLNCRHGFVPVTAQQVTAQVDATVRAVPSFGDELDAKEG